MNICAVRMVDEIIKRIGGRTADMSHLPHESWTAISSQIEVRYSFSGGLIKAFVCKHCGCLYSEVGE